MSYRFSVVLGHKIIGYSDLESHDRGMGTARGLFEPTPAYDTVRTVFRLFAEAQSAAGLADESKLREYYRQRDALPLSIQDIHGARIPMDLIHIEDFRDEGGETAIALEVHPSEASFFAH